MSFAVIGYQIFLCASMYWATSTFGFVGYFLAITFWICHTVSRIGKIWLFLLQSATLTMATYFLWKEASVSLDASLLVGEKFLTKNSVAIFWIVFCGLCLGALYLFFNKISNSVHDAALSFKDRLLKFYSQNKSVKAACTEIVIQQLGIDQFASLNERRYLRVPYQDKGTVKSLGARWDKERQLWYAPEEISASVFEKWL